MVISAVEKDNEKEEELEWGLRFNFQRSLNKALRRREPLSKDLKNVKQ